MPGLPKGKARTRGRIVTAKSGRQFVSEYTPAKTRNEEAVIRDFAEQAMNGRAPFEGPLEVRMRIYLPIPQSMPKKRQEAAIAGELRPTIKPDWDNTAKLTDACNGIVWRDDSQIVAAHVWKYYSVRPGVVIEVRRVVLNGIGNG